MKHETNNINNRRFFRFNSSTAATGDIKDYDVFRQKISAYTKTQFENAPGPEPVMNTVLKIINEKAPKTPKTIAEMAKDARAFIHALGYEKVDFVGFSMGGFVAQEILLQEPQLVRKAIITGTGPAGGEGIKNVTKITYIDILRGLFSFKDAKTYLFFNRNENGKKSAKEFLTRLKERKENRDKKMSVGNLQRQLKAIHAWALQTPQDLSVIRQPVLVANGDNDRMVPSSNTYDLNKRIPNSEIIIYKDAGHGGMFQYHEAFVKSALAFLAK